jgi:MFS family permease
MDGAFCHGLALLDKHADNKRRLPVLSSASEPDEPPRPPWHWVGFGAVAIFATWLPLSALAQLVLRRMLLARFGSEVDEAEMGARLRAMTAGEQARQVMMLAVPHLVALAIGAFAGGMLVGRYGGVTRREPAMAGFFAGFVACVLAFASSGGISWPPLVVVVLATGFAGAGGVVGLRRRA